MIDIGEKKNKIISFLRGVGPSIPVRIAKSVGLEPFLASTLMSELFNEKKVIMSNMRIGSSPLYFLSGQESQLENFSEYLNSTEREAFSRLRDARILIDAEQEPAIRVALRAIKDFAFSFEYKGGLVWRYAFATREEIQNLLNPVEPKAAPKIEIKEEPVKNYFIYKFAGRDKKDVHENVSKLEKEYGKGFVYLRDLYEEGESREDIIKKFKNKIREFSKTNPKMRFIIDYQYGLGRLMALELEEAKKYGFEIVELNKPLEEVVEKKAIERSLVPKQRKLDLRAEPKKKEARPKVELSLINDTESKPEFYSEVIKSLNEKSIELLEEIQIDKKEIIGKVRINSDLGKITYLLMAKNKKSVSKEEISSALQRATYEKMPCLILLKKSPTKPVQKLVDQNNLIKIISME